MIKINKPLVDASGNPIPSGAVASIQAHIGGNLEKPMFQAQVTIHRSLKDREDNKQPLLFNEYVGEAKEENGQRLRRVTPYEVINVSKLSEMDTDAKIEALVLPKIAERFSLKATDLVKS